MSLLLSFQNYSPISGMFGSEFVGFENFAQLFSTPQLGTILKNDIALSLFTEIIPCLVGFGIGVLASTSKNRIFSSLLLLPVFIPKTIYGVLFRFNVSPAIIQNSFLTYLVYGLFTCVPTLFFTAFLVATLSNICKKNGNNKGALIGLCVMIFIALANIFSSDLSASYLALNDLNMRFLETVSTFIFRTSLMMGNYELSSALTIFSSFIELIFAVIFGIILIITISSARKTNPVNTAIKSTGGVGAITAVVAGIVMLISLGLCFVCSLNSQASIAAMSERIFLQMTIAAVTAVMFFIFTGIVGYSCGNLGTALTVIVPTLIVLFSGNFIGSLMQYYEAGFYNTILPVIFQNFINPTLIFAFAVIVLLKGGKLMDMIPTLILFTALNFTNVMGNYFSNYPYTNDGDKYTFSTIFYKNITAGSFPILAIVVMVIVPIIIGILAIILDKVLAND